MLSEKEIVDLVHRGEKVHFEGKEASGGLPCSLWETYSAFSNTDGGVIVLGLPEINHKLTLKGVADPAALIKQFWDTANNTERVSSCSMVDRNAYSLTCRGKQLVVLEVPRADRRSRPVYIGKDVFEGSYRRNGEGDYKCVRSSVVSMLRDSCDESYDAAALEDLELSCLCENTISSYRGRYRFLKPAIEECFDPDRVTIKVSCEEIGDAGTDTTRTKSAQELGERSAPRLPQDCPKTAPRLPKGLEVVYEGLSAATKQVYREMCRDASMTHRGMESKLGLSKTTIRTATATLVAKGLIRRVGPRFGGYWEVVK